MSIIDRANDVLQSLQTGHHVQNKNLREVISGLIEELRERETEYKWAMQQVAPVLCLVGELPVRLTESLFVFELVGHAAPQ